jgi:uncharacterized protein (TIGR02284 family)
MFMATDCLRKLHTSLVDSREGYQEAAKDAETPSLKSFFAEMVALKESDHAELHQALRKMGEEPDESGSFMATVHKTIISVRSAVTGLGANSLPAFVTGEEQIVQQYEEAIRECTADGATVDLLNNQKAALLHKFAVMKSMQT